MSNQAIPKKSLFTLPSMSITAPATVSTGDFEYFRNEIRDLTGIALSDAKKELLQSRLRSRIQEIELEGFGEYRSYLEGLPRSHSEWQTFINLLTTNKTDWFRENAHFDYLIRELIPQWKKKGKSKISIWSSACSTGEEPYTLSMVLDKHWAESGRSYQILATDLDTNVLEHARNGVYRASQITQIPAEYRNAAFSMGNGEIAGWMKVKSHLKTSVTFQQFNLITSRYPWEERFDLVLCRNVLIYFPKEVITQVIQGLHASTTPGGRLFIGHSESIQNLEHSWKYVMPAVLLKESG